jgi:hypothetical protein
MVLDAADKRNSGIDLHTYEKAYFPFKVYKWGDTADPTHHVFRTVYGEGVYIYHKKV